jgi:hypothetical protein
VKEKTMSNVVDFKKAPSCLEAEDIIRELVAKGKFSLTKHCSERMLERGITIQQVITCLLKGKVVDDPYLTIEKGGGYMATVERTVAGDNLRIIVCMKFDQRIMVITVLKYK